MEKTRVRLKHILIYLGASSPPNRFPPPPNAFGVPAAGVGAPALAAGVAEPKRLGVAPVVPVAPSGLKALPPAKPAKPPLRGSDMRKGFGVLLSALDVSRLFTRHGTIIHV